MPARPGCVYFCTQVRSGPRNPQKTRAARLKQAKDAQHGAHRAKGQALHSNLRLELGFPITFQFKLIPLLFFHPLKKKINTTLFIFKLRGKASSSLGFPPSPCHCSLLLWMSTNSSQTALETRRRDELDQKRQEEGQCFAQYLGSTDQHRKKK